MSHYFYITPEEYARAAEIGVDNQTLDRRVREMGWKKERAITTPIRSLDKGRSYWRKVAEQNGISFSAFHSRLSRGWSAEEAATKPKESQEDIRSHALQAMERVRVHPEKYLRMAEQNGIPYHTFHTRVKNLGWDYDRAASEPVWSKKQAGHKGAKALRDREGDWAAQIFGKRQLKS
ncbi:hypothetical protein [Paenibacillus koleovorans]|uniref:hypothetical protein n=1 Tax=Paenibacillus koleovorans TaxID=121608 RepID=UPI000FDC86B9|nr:hypothetical protein [Paenibacillus koleovorans]